MRKSIFYFLTFWLANLSVIAQNFQNIASLIAPLSIVKENLNFEQLQTYNKINSKVGLYSSVNFVTTIFNNADSGRVKIDLPALNINNLQLEATYVNYIDNSNFSWIGRTKIDTTVDESYIYGNFTLLKNNNKFIGHLSYNNASYEIFDLTGGVQLFCETNLSNGSFGCISNEFTKETAISTTTINTFGKCADGTSKVLFLYTPSANSIESDMIGRANLCISQINQNWGNSNINNSLSIAAVKAFEFYETGNILNDINTLKYNTVAQSLRSLYKAEIVVLLTNNDYSGSAGIVAAVDATFNDCYAIVDITQSTSGRYTFTHEVNHLFGAGHDNLADGTTSRRGKSFIVKSGWFGRFKAEYKTVMCVIPAGKSRIEHTSNSNISFNGSPTGDGSRENAEIVNQNKNKIGGYFSDPITNQYQFDMVKNGCSPYWNAFIAICQFNESLYYHWSSSYDGITYFPLTVSGSIVTVPSVGVYFNSLFIPKPIRFVKCEVKNASGTVLYNLNKTIFYHGPCIAVSYKTRKDTSDLNVFFDNISETKIYPNPSEKYFKINFFNFSKQENITVEIISISGQIVKKYSNLEFGNDNSCIIYHDLNAGFYTVRILNNGEQSIQKLIIK